MCPVPTFPYLLIREKLPYCVPKQVLHMLHLSACKASIGGYTSSPICNKGYIVTATHTFPPCLSTPRLPLPVKLPAHSLSPSRYKGHFHIALPETPLLTLSLPTESRTVPFTLPGQRTGFPLQALKYGKGTKTKSHPPVLLPIEHSITPKTPNSRGQDSPQTHIASPRPSFVHKIKI